MNYILLTTVIGTAIISSLFSCIILKNFKNHMIYRIDEFTKKLER